MRGSVSVWFISSLSFGFMQNFVYLSTDVYFLLLTISAMSETMVILGILVGETDAFTCELGGVNGVGTEAASSEAVRG